MAIDAATVWEVRASGSSVNGAGFVDRDPGTSVDYSQQDAAQLSVADLATDGAGTGLSSATGGFTAAMAGNVVQISGGDLTAGWYEITAYTDTNNVTIDRSAGASKSGGTGNVGGAFDFGTALDSDFSSAWALGNTCYIESGSYTIAEDVLSPSHATIAAPITIVGYITTRSTTPYGTDRPLIDCGEFYFRILNWWQVYNVQFTGTDTYVLNAAGSYGFAINCKATNTSASASRNAFFSTTGNMFYAGCEGISTNGPCFTNGYAFNCYAHDCVTGFHNMFAVYCCIADTCSTSGMSGSSLGMWIGNTIYNCGTGINSLSAANRPMFLANNIIDACTTGINADTPTYGLAAINCVVDATTPFGTNVASCIQIGNLTSDPAMTNPAAADFSIGTGSNAYKTGFDMTTYIPGVTI